MAQILLASCFLVPSRSFNQAVGCWKFSSETCFDSMFDEASSFDQSVRNVADMGHVFLPNFQDMFLQATDST